MNSDKKEIISKVIDAYNKVVKSDKNKIILLMPFGLIFGFTTKSDIDEKTELKDVIVLHDVEILPFSGNQANMPVLTVLLDQVLGLSLGNHDG